MICRRHHGSEEQLGCLVDRGIVIVEEQVTAMTEYHWMGWERMYDLLWEKKNPMERGQLNVPHRWHRRCNSLLCSLWSTSFLAAQRDLRTSSRHLSYFCAANAEVQTQRGSRYQMDLVSS